MTDPDPYGLADLDHAQDHTLDDAVMPRPRPNSAAALLIAEGQGHQAAIREWHDLRQRARRVAAVVGLVSLAITLAGISLL